MIWYCWWKKSCTGWLIVYPYVYLSIYRVCYIPGGCLGFLPSTVVTNSFVTICDIPSQLLRIFFDTHKIHPFCDMTKDSTAPTHCSPGNSWSHGICARLPAVKEHNSGHHFQIGKLPPQKNTKWNSHLWCLSLFIISVGSFGSKQWVNKESKSQTKHGPTTWDQSLLYHRRKFRSLTSDNM